MSRIGINGFGRIGRLVLRHAIEDCATVVAINDAQLTVENIAYLFKFDSTHGTFKGTIAIDEDGNLLVNGMQIKIFNEQNSQDIDWASVEAEHIIDCTVECTTIEKASEHLKAGAKKVIIAGPSNDAPMLVCGVNLPTYQKSMNVVSMGSPTSNCMALLASIVHSNFEIVEGLITTVHSVTEDQNTVDGLSSSKFRRYGRGSLQNIIPYATGAAKDVGKIIPELAGKLNAMTFCVPTANVSLIDFTVHLAKETNYERIISKIQEAAFGQLKGILGYTPDDVVSTDFMSDTRSCVVDGKAGIGVGTKMFKLVAWYDNEYAYAKRLVELIRHIQQIDLPMGDN